MNLIFPKDKLECPCAVQNSVRKVFPSGLHNPYSLNDDKSTTEIVAYWQKVFSDLIHWYDVADSKCLGIITISGIMLSFVTIGSFLGTGNSIPQTHSKNICGFYILVLFLFSVLSSVILAVYSLWARIRFDFLSILPTRLRLQKELKSIPLQEKFGHPVTFFSYIADAYPADEEHLDNCTKFFDQQISGYTSKETILRSMAIEITILSTNLKKKYQLINLSFIFVIASLALMSAFVISNYPH